MSLLLVDIIEKVAYLPGLARLLVDCDGNYYPCEKGGFYKIGNVYNGFNYQKIYSFVNNYSEIRNKLCLDCWAIRFCKLCFIGAINSDGKFDKDCREIQCENIKKYYQQGLIRYAEILEENPDAFKRIREWALSQQENYPTL